MHTKEISDLIDYHTVDYKKDKQIANIKINRIIISLYKDH